MALTIREKSVISLHFWEFFWTSSSLRAARKSCSQTSIIELRRVRNLQKDMDMKTLSTFCVAILAASLVTPAAATTQCYVKGDTSQNNPSKPLGGQQNPYGSLAAVSADTSCDTIVVLHSSVVLDGGITLTNAQNLVGQEGPNGDLPMITNSTAANLGAGVVLARDNELKQLHIMNTQFSAIFGSFQIAPFDFGGDVTIQNILVTGANQSGTFLPALGAAAPSIFLADATGANIDIKNSEVGDANVTSIGIYQVAGHGDVRISNTTVRDQGYLSEEYELSPGIAVVAVENSSLDVAIVDTSVSNIGSPFVSNSDGLLLLNSGSGAMTVHVDGYRYSNPDQGGYSGTSTGIEMGFFGSTGGGTFDGVVTNSVIEDAFVAGIQVLDQNSGGSNSLTAKINDNVITGTWFGIQAFTSQSPYSSMFVDISGNIIATANRFDCDCSE
ncbi:MAG: hypothetical protein ACR2QS_12875, partial [Woeseiaceae bacterium]